MTEAGQYFSFRNGTINNSIEFYKKFMRKLSKTPPLFFQHQSVTVDNENQLNIFPTI